MKTKTIDDKFTHAIIANQLALNYNEDLKHHKNLHNPTLKYRLKNACEELIKSELNYDKFFEKEEVSTVDVYNVYESFVKVMSTVPIWEMQNVQKILQAYFTDPKSIEDITNKILRNHE